MSDIYNEVERYRSMLRCLGYFIINQANNDAFILDLMKGDDLPSAKQVLRDIIEHDNEACSNLN